MAESRRAETVEFIRGVNDGLEGKLDGFFNYYWRLLFEEDGSIRIPRGMKV